MARLPGLRDAPELPQLLAGDDVEGARITGHVLRHLLSRGTDDRDVAVDRRRAAVRHDAVPRKFSLRGRENRAVLSEARGRLTRRRVDRIQPVAAHEENARAVRRVAGPVAQAALRRRRATAASSTGRAAAARPPACATTAASPTAGSTTSLSRRRRRSAPAGAAGATGAAGAAAAAGGAPPGGCTALAGAGGAAGGAGAGSVNAHTSLPGVAHRRQPPAGRRRDTSRR